MIGLSTNEAASPRPPEGARRAYQGSAPVDWNAPLPGVMFAFLIPFIVSNGLQGLSSTVSSILIGRYVGVEGLAAVSGFFPVLFFLISFVFGLGAGSTVLIGQAFGAGRMDRVREVAGTTLSATFLIGVIVSAIGAIFAPALLGFIGTPPNVLEQAVSFSRIAFLGPPLVFLYFTYSGFLRGIGDSKTPLWFLVVNTALGIVLTPALMFGWAGLPALGLVGSAWAFNSAAALTVVLILMYLHRIHHPLRLDREMVEHLKIDFGILAAILKIGIPTAVQMVMVSLSEIAVVGMVNRFGSDATAAYGAYYQVANYVQLPAMSLGMSVSIFGAQAIGAGRLDKLREVIRSGMLLNALVGGGLVGLAYLFAGNVLGWFLTDANAFHIAYRLLMITLWSYLVFGAASVLGGIMRASGVVLWPTVLSISAVWGVEIPLAYGLSRQIGVEGIWIGYSAAYVAILALQYGYYSLFWKGRRHERLIQT